jgi:acetolactate synthase-1/3 small subunit
MNTFVVLVENVPGVLTRVSSLVRRRGFNIESLTVGHTENADVSRMTIVIDTDDLGARRVEANLYKLLNVLRVDNLTGRSQVVRDLALIKVSATPQTRAEVLQLTEVFRARVVDVSSESVMIEATGPEEDRQPGRRAAAVRHHRNGAHRPRRHGPRLEAGRDAHLRGCRARAARRRRVLFCLGVLFCPDARSCLGVSCLGVRSGRERLA